MPSKTKKNLYKKMLTSFVNSLTGVFVSGPSGRWPMPTFKSSGVVSFYSGPFLIKDFLEKLKRLQQKGFSLKEIGRLYRYPSRLARLIHLFSTRNLWPLSQKEKLEVGYTLAQILATLYKEDLFCQKGKNIIYSKRELRKILDNAKNQFFSKKFLPQLKQLSGLLWMLAEAFFPRFQNTFFEFSGPYELDGKIVILKEYHDLKPPYLPISFEYKFENLTIIEIYQKNIQFKLDICNRSFGSQKDEKKLKKFSILIENKPVLPSQLPKIIQSFQKTLKKSIKYLNSLDSKEKIIIFNGKAEYFCFIYPLAEKLKESWKPPKEFFKIAKIKKLPKNYQKTIKWFLSLPKTKKGWYQGYDLEKQPNL